MLGGHHRRSLLTPTALIAGSGSLPDPVSFHVIFVGFILRA
jgi:hypothetical protein